MNNTIPFNPTANRTVRTEQITVDVNILSVLKHATSPGNDMADDNVYLAAIGPDMELTVIMEEDAPHILPCFDESDELIVIENAPLYVSYNPAQIIKLAGKHYLTGAVVFFRTDNHGNIVSLTVEDIYRFQTYLETHSVTLMATTRSCPGHLHRLRCAMLIFFIGFAFFEFGALCGFFAAALMQAARDGDERAGRSRAENIQYRGVHHEADRPDDSECWTDSTSAVSVKITGR